MSLRDVDCRGREFVEENFDVRKLNRRLVDIYEAVIAGELPSDGGDTDAR